MCAQTPVMKSSIIVFRIRGKTIFSSIIFTIKIDLEMHSNFRAISMGKQIHKNPFESWCESYYHRHLFPMNCSQ